MRTPSIVRAALPIFLLLVLIGSASAALTQYDPPNSVLDPAYWGEGHDQVIVSDTWGVLVNDVLEDAQKTYIQISAYNSIDWSGGYSYHVYANQTQDQQNLIGRDFQVYTYDYKSTQQQNGNQNQACYEYTYLYLGGTQVDTDTLYSYGCGLATSTKTYNYTFVWQGSNWTWYRNGTGMGSIVPQDNDTARLRLYAHAYAYGGENNQQGQSYITYGSKVLLIEDSISVTAIEPPNGVYDDNITDWTYYVEPFGSVGIASCSLYAGGVYRASNSTDVIQFDNNTITWTPSAEGIYPWYVSCLGNDSNYYNSTARTFTYDTTAPVITINLPQATNYSAYAGEYTNITFSDNYNLASCAYNITNGTGSIVESWSGACSGTSYTYVNPFGFTSHGEGTFTINVTTTDAVGFTTTSSRNFNVTRGVWHLNEWSYRIPFITTETGGSNRTNYWSNLTIPYDLISPYMDSACTSPRVVDSVTGDTLLTGISACNATGANVTIAFKQNITASQTKTMYLYLDKSARLCDDGAYYDTFSDTSVDSTLWGVYTFGSSGACYYSATVTENGTDQAVSGSSGCGYTSGSPYGDARSTTMALPQKDEYFFKLYESYYTGGSYPGYSYPIGYIFLNSSSGLVQVYGAAYNGYSYNHVYYNPITNITYLYRNTGAGWSTSGSVAGRITGIQTRAYCSSNAAQTGGGETMDMLELGYTYASLFGLDYPTGISSYVSGSTQTNSNVTFLAYHEDTKAVIQNFTVTYGGTAYATTNGGVSVEASLLPSSGAAVFSAFGYATRTLYANIPVDRTYTFYTEALPNSSSMIVDVRNSTNFSTEPNTWTELWYGCMKLHEGYSDSAGLLQFVGDPLKQYTMKYGSPLQTTTWQVELVIGMIQDERTGVAVYADVVLNNGTMEVHYSNQTWIAITRYQIANYSVPWGESVSIIIGSDDYPAREYFMTIDDTQRRRLMPKLLNIYDGVLAKFVTIDAYQSVIPDASITIRRLYGTSYTTVAQKMTDSAGQAQIFLDPYTRYQLHAEGDGEEYDGYIEAQAGVTYYIVLGGASMTYTVTSPVKIGYASKSPTYGDLMSLMILDTNSNLNNYTMALKTQGGVTLYNVTGSEATGETFVVNTSDYPAPPNIFTPWVFTVNYYYQQEYYSTSFVVYFNSSGNETGLSQFMDMASDNDVMSPEMRNAVSLLILIAGATSLAAVAPGFVLPFVVILAVVLGVAGWLDYRAVLLAIGASGLLWWASRRGMT